MLSVNHPQLFTTIKRTRDRLDQLSHSQENALFRYTRATVQITFLLQTLAAAYLPEDAQAEMQQIVSLYTKLENEVVDRKNHRGPV